MDTNEVEKVDYHVAGKSKYRCRFCANEENKKCLAKPGRSDVKLNKKRSHCKEYKFDEVKFNSYNVARRPIPITRRPDWYWLTRQQRRRLAELLQSSVAIPPVQPAHLQRNIVTPFDSEKLIWTPDDDK